MTSVSSEPSGIMPGSPVTGIAEGKSPRILSLDVLRGVAVLGILIVSIWEFGGFTNNKQLFYKTGTHGGNYNLMSFVAMVFEGKMLALFSIAFGAGTILFLSRKDHPSVLSVADLYIRRMLWLLIFGIFSAIVLLWPGDFLFHFAVLGILLFPFWRMSQKGLLIAAIITTLIYCGKSYWNYADDKKTYRKYVAITEVEKKFKKDSIERFKKDSIWVLANKDSVARKLHKDSIAGKLSKDTAVKKLMNDSLAKEAKNDTLTKQQAKDKGAWEGLVKGLKYDTAADKRENKAMRTTSYTKIWDHLLGRSQNKESYWLYRTGIWDIGSMMFLGMALLGFGFFGDRFPMKKYLLLAIPFIIAGLGLAWFRIHYQDIKLADYAKYIENNFIPFNQFFPVERFLLATGYAALIIALLRLNIFKWLWRTLATVGQMAFTNYFLQVIICTVFFYGYGMGYFGRLSQVQLYFMVAEVWLIQIVFSVLWMRYFTMGPVEWFWKYLVYRKKLPFKKPVTVIPDPNPATT
ncbi:MAG TPA: DUF418 domain-containing protein [Chitinophagaceae bacterium]